MTKVNQVYICRVCGNIVEVLRAGAGELVCCDQPMELLVEKTADTGKEKHVPVVQQTSSGILIKVGSIPHPMEPKHYIEWIELVTEKAVYRKYFNPSDQPQAEFPVQEKSAFIAREHCNVHGLWRT